MDFTKLKQGDVLLFAPEPGSFISWAICFLSGAPVSHAALYYDAAANTIVEENPPHVEISPLDFEERFRHRPMYVRRHNDNLDLTPVLNAAEGYCNDAEPYARTGLYLVGLLLIYKKYTHSGWVQRATIKILKKLTKAITTFIDNQHHPGKLPMVCSQFVAQCYKVAGSPYELQFEGAILEKSEGTKHLLDRTMEQMRNDDALKRAIAGISSPESPDQTEEELCEELKSAFDDMGDYTDPEEEILQELHHAVIEFTHAHHQLSKGEQPLDKLLEVHIKEALRHQKELEPMFVSPGDLLSQCTSLHEIIWP